MSENVSNLKLRLSANSRSANLWPGFDQCDRLAIRSGTFESFELVFVIKLYEVILVGLL